MSTPSLTPFSTPTESSIVGLETSNDISTYNGRNYNKITTNLIQHSTPWQVWQAVQAFFLAILSLGVGLFIPALRQAIIDKWKQAVTGQEKVTIQPPLNSATFKTIQAGETLPSSKLQSPSLANNQKDARKIEEPSPSTTEILPKSHAGAQKIQTEKPSQPHMELPLEVKRFVSQAREEITQMSPADLEKGLKEALKVGVAITQPDDKTTLFTVAEKVAQSYLKGGAPAQAFQIRMQTAQAIAPAGPLANLQSELVKEDSTFGLRLQPVGTSLIKNQTLIVQRKKFTDGKTQLHVSAKLSHHVREQLKATVDQLSQTPKHLLDVLPEGFCKSINVTTEETVYQGRTDKDGVKWKGDFSSDIHSFGFKVADPSSSSVCKSQVIYFEGVGKIRVGSSSDFLAEYNRLTIELDPDVPEAEATAKLHILFATLGLGSVSSSPRAEDKERIKIMQLFRAFYPREAFQFERDAISFEESIDSLKARIVKQVNDMESKFKHYFVDKPDDMYQQEVYPGQFVWSIKGLAQKVREVGGIGLMAGLTADTFVEATQRLISILETGALSIQDRFQAGLIATGISAGSDLKAGGGESVFVRLITNKMSKYPGDYVYAKTIQILYDLDLVERVGYAYGSDKYGTKDLKPYSKRLNIVNLTKQIENNPAVYLDNEICIRNRIAPQFIKGVVVETDSEKKDLIEALERAGLVEKKPSGDYIHGILVDQFIHVGNFKSEYWD